MPVKTPRFWQENGIAAKLLSPLSCLYLLGHKLNQALAKQPYESSIPVLCIGGVVTGGSGKTPTLHAILDLIRRDNIFQNPVILTRGYGGTIKTATLVDPAKHSVSDVGDEALLHAGKAPTIVSPDRGEGAKLAECMNADIILMDDGLQNNSLIKTASILVMNAAQGWGNGRLLPAGPLREPFADALAKSNMVVLVGEGDLAITAPYIKAHIVPAGEIDTTKNYHGFAGLGDPEKFRRTLIESGVRLAGFTSFADHHAYCEKDMDALQQDAGSSTLITTEKDFVRIPAHYRGSVETFPIQIAFADEAALLGILKGMKQ